MSQDTIASLEPKLDTLIAQFGPVKVAQHVLDSLADSRHLSANAKKELRPALRRIMTAQYERPRDADPMSFGEVVALGQAFVSAKATKGRLRELLETAAVELLNGK